LSVSGGQSVAVATREAIPGDSLATLESVVRERLEGEAEQERGARTHAEQLRLQAIRQMIGFLRPGGVQ
jgi:F-type H+-transporting ATPase subunit epsilon